MTFAFWEFYSILDFFFPIISFVKFFLFVQFSHNFLFCLIFPILKIFPIFPIFPIFQIFLNFLIFQFCQVFNIFSIQFSNLRGKLRKSSFLRQNDVSSEKFLFRVPKVSFLIKNFRIYCLTGPNKRKLLCSSSYLQHWSWIIYSPWTYQ